MGKWWYQVSVCDIINLGVVDMCVFPDVCTFCTFHLFMVLLRDSGIAVSLLDLTLSAQPDHAF